VFHDLNAPGGENGNFVLVRPKMGKSSPSIQRSSRESARGGVSGTKRWGEGRVVVEDKKRAQGAQGSFDWRSTSQDCSLNTPLKKGKKTQRPASKSLRVCLGADSRPDKLLFIVEGDRGSAEKRQKGPPEESMKKRKPKRPEEGCIPGKNEGRGTPVGGEKGIGTYVSQGIS